MPAQSILKSWRIIVHHDVNAIFRQHGLSDSPVNIRPIACFDGINRPLRIKILILMFFDLLGFFQELYIA